ncbi:type II toxin-antitoxin system VapB family antitoxin [Rhodoferax sp.]|uniref:antitoxin n=1 Tax=Rhodoferax sp. TaxID=50421 RepID=UPI0026120769|nr:type II toxin-antitoxin system VapB family antitoxin [Rhodoferax sp.]MDD2808732.1 type II toxin-antitoxin system VapB family antitoxin [Rhodoferax sp.]
MTAITQITKRPVISTPGVAKVFTTGRSQAVRLPKAFRFDTKEVTIEREGDAVIMRPKRTEDEWWTEVVQALQGFEGMDFVERDRTPLVDDILLFDDALPPQN